MLVATSGPIGIAEFYLADIARKVGCRPCARPRLGCQGRSVRRARGPEPLVALSEGGPKLYTRIVVLVCSA